MEHILKFGIHKGKSIHDLPDNYLLFLIKNKKLNGKLLIAVKRKLNLPMDLYRITIQNLVNNMDGVYTIKGYNTFDARTNFEQQYGKIQASQSFHGTEISI